MDKIEEVEYVSRWRLNPTASHLKLRFGGAGVVFKALTMLVVTGRIPWPPVPALMVSNLEFSLDWYLRAVGFRLLSKGYASAHLQWAGYSSLLLVADRSRLPGGPVKPMGFRYCFWSEGDLYRLTARVVQLGGQIETGPGTDPWGIREVTFRDPDGHLLTFCQHVSFGEREAWLTAQRTRLP